MMKIAMKTVWLWIVIPCLLAATANAAEKVKQGAFDGILVLVEDITLKPFKPPPESFYAGFRDYELVHNPTGRIAEVYDGPMSMIGREVSLTSPMFFDPQPDQLIHMHTSYEGVHVKDRAPQGAKCIVALMPAGDFDRNDSMRTWRNPFGFPFRSIFVKVHDTAASGLVFDNRDPESFAVALEWAQGVKRFNQIEDEAHRLEYLKESVSSTNPLICVTAVHLLVRFFPDAAYEYFDQTITRPGIPFEARLAMDHELCLARQEVWINGGQKALTQLLTREAEGDDRLRILLGWRDQMVANRSWFHRTKQRDIP